MDDSDVVDAVNALTKLGVGDPYRLEHIKQAYIQNKTLWDTDQKYLERLREKYLLRLIPKSQTDVSEGSTIASESTPQDFIHCWHCGSKNPIAGNFCMVCGYTLFEVGKGEHPGSEKISRYASQPKQKTTSKKIPIMIVIPVLILAIVGVGASQGLFSDVFDKSPSVDIAEPKSSTSEETTSTEPKSSTSEETTSTETHSKCGKGTIFDSKTNSCILSKCGPGTVLDPKTNSCVLDK